MMIYNFLNEKKIIEQTFNAKLLEMKQKFKNCSLPVIFLLVTLTAIILFQISKLQQATDEKEAGNLRIIEDQHLQDSNLKNSIDEKAAKFVQYKDENEQTFNAKFLEITQKFELQLSKLQQATDEKVAQFKEEYNKTVAQLDKNNKEQQATFNAKLLEMNQKFELQLSKLQQAADEKAAGDLRIIEDLRLQNSNLQSSVDEKAAKFVQYKDENNKAIAQINRENEELINNLKKIFSELNPQTSVILLGGWHSAITDSIRMFNSKEKKWINSHVKLPDKFESLGSVILHEEIYIFGGYNGNEYCKLTYKLGENGEWIKLADMNKERNGIEKSSVVFEDEIWVFGGQDDRYSLRTVDKYNKQKNIWIKMPEMREARNAPAVSIINGKFYVSGGHNGRSLNTIEVYDPEKKKWEIFSNLPLALSRHTSIVVGTNLIIIGGKKSDDKPSAEIWKIDVMDPKKEWKKMPNLKQPRYDHGAVQLEDEFMVIGGSIDIATRIDSVEIFDGQKWIEGSKLPEKRGYFPLIPLSFINEKVFLRRLCK